MSVDCFGEPVAVIYLPTGAKATARPVLTQGRYSTSFDGWVVAGPGWWMVQDGTTGYEYPGRSLWSPEQFARDFRKDGAR